MKIILFGGLGNQLFQYFAGMYVARRNNAILKVDSTFSQLGRTGHNDWINILDLPGVNSVETRRLSFQYLCSRVRRFGRSIVKKFVLNQNLRAKIFRQYFSAVLGYDSTLSNLRPPITLQGYFQTWRYYDFLMESGKLPQLAVNSPTKWYLAMEEKLINSQNALGVHVRRGDYEKNPQIGTLTNLYYSRAISALLEKNVSIEEIWVFSDIPAAAKKELDFFPLEHSKVFFVSPPEESHSMESLLLMSKMPALVIANSTFSWWGAKLGSSDRPIVCPDKWFSKLDDPSDLCPQEWIRVSSSWHSEL